MLRGLWTERITWLFLFSLNKSHSRGSYVYATVQCLQSGKSHFSFGLKMWTVEVEVVTVSRIRIIIFRVDLWRPPFFYLKLRLPLPCHPMAMAEVGLSFWFELA